MNTRLCNAGLDFDEFPLNINNRCVAPNLLGVATSANVPYRPIQDDRMHHDESGQERFLAIAEEETCVDADSAIEKSIETANMALSLYGYKGPPYGDSGSDLYVRLKCYAAKLAPFEPCAPVS